MKKIVFMGLLIGVSVILNGADDQANHDKAKSNVTWAAAKTAGYGIGAYCSLTTTWGLSERFLERGIEKVAGRSFDSKADLSKFLEYVNKTPIEHRLLKDVNKVIRYRYPVAIGGVIMGIGAAGYCALKAWDSSLDLISSLKKL